MDKRFFTSILRKLHLATREHVGVEPIWRIMMTLALLLFITLVLGGWYVYDWSTTETAVVNRVKPVNVTITEDELNKVETDVAQRNDHYESLLQKAPDVVAISGNASEPIVGTSTATSTKK